MSETAARRPGQVTAAALTIMLASTLVVVFAFEMVAGLRSLETRERLGELLADPYVRAAGFDLATMRAMLHVASLVSAGCAAAAAILGYRLLRRDRAARTALTLLAVPMTLAGVLSGGVLTLVVAAAVAVLWCQPARAWFAPGGHPGGVRHPAFAGHPSQPPSTDTPTRVAPAATPLPGARQTGSSGPPAAPSPGAPPAHWARDLPPGPTEPPPGAFGQAARPTGPAVRRPGAVVAACVLTWTLSGLGVLLQLPTLWLVATDPQALLAELYRQRPELAEAGVSAELMTSAVYGVAGVLLGWCGLAMLLAVLTFRRTPWARTGLVASAALAAVLAGVAAMLSSGVMLIPLMGAALTVSLLMRPESRRWCSPAEAEPEKRSPSVIQ